MDFEKMLKKYLKIADENLKSINRSNNRKAKDTRYKLSLKRFNNIQTEGR